MMSKQDYMRAMLREMAKAYLRWDEELRSTKQENARLREALELIAGDSPDIDSMYASVARAALGQGSSD